MKLTAMTLLAAALAAAPAGAEEKHRELGPHVHGHGTLNIAIENNRVSMELEAPGMDIVGFEHRAESKKQKTAVEKANALLGQPLSLFKLPKSAGCRVADSKVSIDAEHEHDHEHEDGEEHHDAKSNEEGGEQAKEEHAHAEPEQQEGHNEFHATYTLDCDKPVNLTSIQFDYFKSFPGANELTVNVVTGKAQNTFEVARDKPSLDLGGMM